MKKNEKKSLAKQIFLFCKANIKEELKKNI